MAASSVWGALQAFGESVLQLECANKLDLEVREDEKITVEKDAGVSMDGLFVNIREEGWKELKVGSVFTFSAQTSLRRNKQGELIQEVKANTQTYVSHLGGPEGIGMKVENETQRRDWFRARQQAVVGDGANWIWKQAELYFPDSAHIVDWYHAKQHLSAAADNLYPTQPERKATWLEAAAEKLYNGQAKGIARQVRKGPCPQDAGYFDENHERMQYRDFQSAALPIGSGTIEAAAKMYQGRLAGTGMRWSRNGLQHILPFRDSILSSRFDALWQLLCP